MKPISALINLLIFFCCLTIAGQAQTITVKGRTTNNDGVGGLYQVIVINQRTSEGMMAEAGGLFNITVLKTDTLLVTASGFSVKKICFHDSAYRSEYRITVKLDSIHYKLEEVKVYPKKNLRDINEERSRLGNVPNTDLNPDANILDPISYLYERFSRLERSKRKVAQLEDEQNRREVLKDMLHLYIRHDIITLTDAQFDDFIDYCNLSDYFIKTSTDYDLITTIKTKYEQYEKQHAYYNAPSSYTRYDK